jgi:hypothetical protein
VPDGVVNQSGKVQILYDNGNPVTFNPGDVVPVELAFIDGSVHPSLLPPPAARQRAYRRCGCCPDDEEDG